MKHLLQSSTYDQCLQKKQYCSINYCKIFKILFFSQHLKQQKKMDSNKPQNECFLSVYSQKPHKVVTRNIGSDSLIYTTEYLRLTQIEKLFFNSVFLRRQMTRLLSKKENVFTLKVLLSQIKDLTKEQIQNILVIKTEQIEKENIFQILRKMEIKQTQDLSTKFDLICNVIIKLIICLMTRSNYQIHNSKVISIIKNEQINEITVSFYQASVIGIKFVQQEEGISVEEFTQICQILNLKALIKNKKQRFTFQLKFRTIAKILLELILGRKISLFGQLFKAKNQYQDKQQRISFETALNLLEDIKNHYQELLCNAILKKRIEQLQKMGQVKFYDFLYAVFVEETDLTWTDVISMIVPQTRTTTSIPQHINIFTFQNMMKKYQQVLLATKDKEYILLLKELGLFGQFKPLFIALMSLSTDSASQIISYEDLTELIYIPNNFDLLVKDQIYCFLNGILGDIANHMYALQQEKQRVGNVEYQMQMDEEWLVLQQQLQSMQSALSQNFGKFQIKMRKSRFITKTYYSLGYDKFKKALE